MSPWSLPVLSPAGFWRAAHDPLVLGLARRLAEQHKEDEGFCGQCGQVWPCYVRLFTDPLLVANPFEAGR